MFCLLKGQGYPFIRERNFLNKDRSISDYLWLLLEVWSQWDNIFNMIQDGYGTSQVALVGKNPPANAGDGRETSLIPGWGVSPGGGLGNPLQCSHLKSSVDRGARQLQSTGSQRVGHNWSGWKCLLCWEEHEVRNWKLRAPGSAELKPSVLLLAGVFILCCGPGAPSRCWDGSFSSRVWS